MIMTLAEKIGNKALIELREDDFRKKQALEQFRDWISKQGHIKNCRTGLWIGQTMLFRCIETASFFRRQFSASVSASEKICKRRRL